MHIKSNGVIEKASKLNEGEVEFVVSTDDWDAHGERIDVNGIDYKTYLKKNNVILFGHDSFNLPIGNATKMWLDGNKLMARAKFYLKDDFPRKVYQYIMDGVLKAVSIGGIVEEWGEDGLTIKKLTMKEFSVVSVPANENALVSAKSLNGNEKAEFRALANAYARKCLVNKEEKTELSKNIDMLENLVATLKEVANLSETHEGTAEQENNSMRVVLRQAQVVDNQVEKIIKVVKKGNSNNE